jgi:hypothetical protein
MTVKMLTISFKAVPVVVSSSCRESQISTPTLLDSLEIFGEQSSENVL